MKTQNLQIINFYKLKFLGEALGFKDVTKSNNLLLVSVPTTLGATKYHDLDLQVEDDLITLSGYIYDPWSGAEPWLHLIDMMFQNDVHSDAGCRKCFKQINKFVKMYKKLHKQLGGN